MLRKCAKSFCDTLGLSQNPGGQREKTFLRIKVLNQQQKQNLVPQRIEFDSHPLFCTSPGGSPPLGSDFSSLLPPFFFFGVFFFIFFVFFGRPPDPIR